LQASAETEGAALEVIGPHIGEVKSNSGVAITPNHAIAAAPSVLFDTVVVAVSETEIDTLKKQAAVLNFIRDGYAHLKIIGHTAASMPLLEIAGISLDDGVVEVDASEGTIAYVDAAKKERIWPRAAAIKA